MLIGYARVSTQDQHLDLQREALIKAGCEKIMEDQISGARAERPGLAQALGDLRAGDTLVVWKLDRLGRSVRNLIDLVSSLQARDVQFTHSRRIGGRPQVRADAWEKAGDDGEQGSIGQEAFG
ncbi:MAG: recombinase family protein [Acidithiobacillus sp.]